MIDGTEKPASTEVREFRPCTIPLPRLTPPVAGQVDLWFLDLGGLAGSLREALGGEPQETFRLDGQQLRFARRFYLRLLLGAYLDLPGKSVRINRKQRGKPVLDASVHDTELHFSMAKSEDRLLIGFSTSSHIGVDLEPAGRRARDPRGLAQRYFSPDESSALSAMPASDLDAAFLRAWACKEAVVKASGAGIANQFGRFTVDTDPARFPSILNYEGKPAQDWTLALVRPDQQFLGAVAIQDAVTLIRAFRLLPAGQSGD